MTPDNGDYGRYLAALRFRIPVSRHRYLMPWWLIGAGYSLGLARAALFDGRFGWTGFHLCLAVWMLWPLRSYAPLSGQSGGPQEVPDGS